MPSYIGYRPQYEPISLQEYFTVPMMILEGRQKEADKIEQYQNEAEKYRAMMGDSPEAQSIWAAYDNALNNLGDNILNNKTGDLIRAAKKIGDSFRNIKYKAEEAYNKQKKYQDMLDKNPNLIGNAGTVMDYYGKDYTPTFVDSKDLAASIGSIVATEAERSPSRYIGTNPQSGLEEYIQGITPEELGISVQNAINGTPNDNISIGIKRYLDNIGYSNLSPDLQDKIKENIYKSALANSGMKKTINDPLKRKQIEASIDASRASAALHWQSYRENQPDMWNDVDEVTVDGKHYTYKAVKLNNGNIRIVRSPMSQNKQGKWVITNNNFWEPASYYIRDGETYNELPEYAGAGVYGHYAPTSAETKTTSTEPEYINYTSYDKSGKSQQHSSASVPEDLKSNKVNFEDLPENVQTKIINNNTTVNTRSNFNASEYDIYQSIDAKGKPVYHVYKKNPKNKSTVTESVTTDVSGY